MGASAPDPREQAPAENLEVDEKLLDDLDEDQSSDVKGGRRAGSRTLP